uniref:Uncharacterized protein n=1 Tax=Macrostomum lignano TaxID=282301 RepID=A0A1I8IW10_9PLAT
LYRGSNRNQISVVLTQLYCWHLNLVASAGSDVGSECYRRAVSCIQCSTESVHEPTGARLCRDPFDARIKTEFKQLHKSSASSLAAGGPIAAIVKYNISTVMCDGYCIKWVKVPLLVGMPRSSNFEYLSVSPRNICSAGCLPRSSSEALAAAFAAFSAALLASLCMDLAPMSNPPHLGPLTPLGSQQISRIEAHSSGQVALAILQPNPQPTQPIVPHDIASGQDVFELAPPFQTIEAIRQRFMLESGFCTSHINSPIHVQQSSDGNSQSLQQLNITASSSITRSQEIISRKYCLLTNNQRPSCIQIIAQSFAKTHQSNENTPEKHDLADSPDPMRMTKISLSLGQLVIVMREFQIHSASQFLIAVGGRDQLSVEMTIRFGEFLRIKVNRTVGLVGEALVDDFLGLNYFQ